MSIQRFDTGPRMSQVVIHGDTIYLAGVAASNAGGESVTRQTQDVLATIDGQLKKAGSDKSKLLTATIYLTDMNTFPEMNAVWDGWVSAGNTPARAPVEGRLAAPRYNVEIMGTGGREGRPAGRKRRKPRGSRGAFGRSALSGANGRANSRHLRQPIASGCPTARSLAWFPPCRSDQSRSCSFTMTLLEGSSCSFLITVVCSRGSLSRLITVVRSRSRSRSCDSPTVTPAPTGPTPTPTRVSSAFAVGTARQMPATAANAIAILISSSSNNCPNGNAATGLLFPGTTELGPSNSGFAGRVCAMTCLLGVPGLAASSGSFSESSRQNRNP